MNAFALLELLRDARELGDAAFEASVLDQLGVDIAYVRFETAQVRVKPVRRSGDDEDYDDIDEEESVEEFRARVGEQQRYDDRRDWLKWQRRCKSIDSLSAIYKAHYSEDLVAVIANRPHPFFSMIERKRLTDETIEMRTNYGHSIEFKTKLIGDVE